MGQTLVEKIISEHAGKDVKAGELMLRLYKTEQGL